MELTLGFETPSKKRCGVPKQRPQRSKRSVVPVNPEGAVRRVEYWGAMDGVSVSVYSSLRYYLLLRRPCHGYGNFHQA